MWRNNVNIVNTLDEYVIANNKKKGGKGAALYHTARNVNPDIRGAPDSTIPLDVVPAVPGLSELEEAIMASNICLSFFEGVEEPS